MQFACFRAFKIPALPLQNPCTDPYGIQGEPCGTVLSSSFSVASVSVSVSQTSIEATTALRWEDCGSLSAANHILRS